MVVVVTGGSSGIGLATAQLFAKKGHKVYELSRSGEDSPGITHITADVTDEDAVNAAFSEIAEKEGQIDVLINNAGFGISGAVELTGLLEAKRLMDVNFFGSFICNKAAIPYLRETKGSIVHVSSVGGPIAIPFQAFYSCSKAAINALTLALANEVRPFGIRVSAVMPGDAKTGFTAVREKSIAGSELYGNRIEKSVAVMERDEQNGAPPISIARAIYKQAKKKRPKPIHTIGLQYKAFIMLYRVLPWRLVNWVVGKMY